MRFVFALLALAALVAAPARTQQFEQRIVNGRPTLVQVAAPKIAPVAKPVAPDVKPAAPQVAPAQAAPVEAPLAGAPHLPTGVQFDKLSPVEKCTYGGADVDAQACYELLGGTSLADDSKKRSVSISDPDPKRRAEIVTEVKAAVGDRAKIWDGPPDDWSWRPGFRPAPDRPTIVCQAADGEVLHRQEGLEGGKEALIEAVRKAVPEYDPHHDPDLRHQFQFPDLTKHMTVETGLELVLLAAVCVLLFTLLRK